MADRREDQVPEAVAAVVAASAGALVDLAAAPAGGPVAAALTPLLVWGERAMRRRQTKAAAALAEAAASAEMSADDVLELVDGNDRLNELAARALAAAAAATTDAKIRALGRALASGVLAADEATVDAEMLVVDALARLEAAHVRVLDLVSATCQPQRNGVMYRSADLAWTPDLIRAKYPQIGDALEPVLATLTSLHAIRDVGVGSQGWTPDRPTYSGTTFGRVLLTRLREAGLESTPE
jgi:hypothetical protein